MKRVVGGKEPDMFRLRPEEDLWGTQRVVGPQCVALPKRNVVSVSVKP